MDFNVLSKYDDICASLFLDKQYLWFETIKMNEANGTSTFVFPSSYQIRSIIYANVIAERNIKQAVLDLLNLPFFQSFTEPMDTRGCNEFTQHMKRYLLMYMPAAGYEISDTTRYSGVEACLVATKEWHVGDEIRYCTGVLASLGPDDYAALKKSKRDFSVIYSQRKQADCLFLGPARFMNHDCGANTKFISDGDLVTFKVTKDIAVGAEITTFYGAHYFGEGNCECRCVTCESNQVGHFTNHDRQGDDAEDLDEPHRRSKRRRKQTLYKEFITNYNTPKSAGSKLTEATNDASLSSTPSTIPSSIMGSGTDDQENCLANAMTPATPLHAIREDINERHATLASDPSDAGVSTPLILRATSTGDQTGGLPAMADLRIDSLDTYDILDKQLDDDDDLSDCASDLSIMDADALKALDKACVNACVACTRPLYPTAQQQYTLQVNDKNYQEIRAHALKRCWRCARHFMLFGLEWPSRQVLRLKYTKK
ncbi:SET domain-containing protein [Hesseltinella vesiculosa]|uniref:SET domain-containing protein n=1 Tax=Hesseltinella vesiculosa TaxID=101127 RepID=A0A1X2G335_9FUNG|nr:SET domain-containing protein [Hesseltinella vesiculosa]